MDSYICAIDVGTTGVKAGIVDTDGYVRSEAYAEYGVEYRPPFIAEQDPDTLWRGAVFSTQKNSHGGNRAPDPGGVHDQSAGHLRSRGS